MNYTLAFKSLVSLALFASLVPGAAIADAVSAVTHPASDITETGARLNGYALNPQAQITTWFEWGTTPSFGNQTNSRMYWGEHTSKAVLSNLEPGTRYYFRAVMVGGAETRYGETLSFTTAGTRATSASTGSSNTASAVGASTGTGSTSGNTTSQTTVSNTTKSSASTAKTTTTTKSASNAKATDTDCATTTAALAGGSLAASAAGSTPGVSGLIVFLVVTAIALAIVAAVMQIRAAREAARRKQAEQGMVLA